MRLFSNEPGSVVFPTSTLSSVESGAARPAQYVGSREGKLQIETTDTAKRWHEAAPEGRWSAWTRESSTWSQEANEAEQVTCGKNQEDAGRVLWCWWELLGGPLYRPGASWQRVTVAERKVCSWTGYKPGRSWGVQLLLSLLPSSPLPSWGWIHCTTAVYALGRPSSFRVTAGFRVRQR